MKAGSEGARAPKANPTWPRSPRVETSPAASRAGAGAGGGGLAAVPLAETDCASEALGARRARRPPPPPVPASAGAASSLRPARPPSLPPLVAGSGGGGGRRGGRAPAERCRRRGKGSFKWKVVRRPARPPALLRQHHGGADRLACARPAAPAGGSGDSNGGDGPSGRDSSAGPGGSRGPDPGPRRAGGRLAHLQGCVRAAGGYRSVRRVRRGRTRPGAEAGWEARSGAGGDAGC